MSFTDTGGRNAGAAGRPWALTRAVEVHHEAVLHVLLDQLQRPLEYLASARLLHSVGVPRVAEQGQQVVGGARLANDSQGRGKKGTITKKSLPPKSEPPLSGK